MSYTNLKQDPEYKKEFESKNFKSLKYHTQNFNDPKVNLNKLLTFQSEFSNVSNSLRYSEVVASRQKTILPPLPMLTTPSLIRGQQNVVIEDSIRPNMIRDRKSCNPKENQNYNRTFQIFDSLPVVFNTPQTPFVQANHSLRGGVDTHSMKYTYANKK